MARSFLVQALASPKAICIYRLPDYLAVYPKFNIDLLKLAVALPLVEPGPIETSTISHLGPTGPSSLPN